MKQLPTIFSYYTVDTPYQETAAELKRDCERLGLAHYFVGVKSLGSKHQNQTQKISLLKDFMDKFDKPFIWVDADSRIWGKPSLFMEAINKNIDFMYYYRNTGHFQGYKGGVMFFNNTQASKSLLNWMVKISEYNPLCHDESVIKLALEQLPNLHHRWINEDGPIQDRSADSAHPYFSTKKNSDTVIQIQYSDILGFWGNLNNPSRYHPEDNRPLALRTSVEIVPSLLPGNVPPQSFCTVSNMGTTVVPVCRDREIYPDIENYFIEEKEWSIREAVQKLEKIIHYQEIKKACFVNGIYKLSSVPEFSYGYVYKITEYKYYFKRHPQNLKNMPPIQVIQLSLEDREKWKIYDGVQRLLALVLLSEEDRAWNDKKIKVKFYKSIN